jgi:hypothetical protein
MALVTIVEPQSEPVVLGDMKQFLRLDAGFSDDDSLIAGLIQAARRWAEVYTRRRFIYQTVRLEMDFFPGYIDANVVGGASHYAATFASGVNLVLAGIRYAVQMPFPPVHHIAAFTYTDQNGTTQPVLPLTQYVADLDSNPARLMPPFGQFWPVAQVIPNAVRIDFVAGYGANVTVGATAGSAALTGYTFVAEDVGSPITIAGAGVGGNAFVGTVLAVDGSGHGTLSANAVTTAANAATYLGKPVPPMIAVAIMLLVSYWYEERFPDDQAIPFAVKACLSPYRDLRF